MGHTNYWTRDSKLHATKFADAAKDCRKILKHLGVPLAGRNGTGSPIFHADEIAFNGKSPHDYETFSVLRVIETGEPKEFQFCKTALRPYDICVQAALIVLRHHLNEAISVSSDGNDAAWNTARAACQKWLGYGTEFRLEG